jgi:tRNA (guanine37-N1)-methyltransferase
VTGLSFNAPTLGRLDATIDAAMRIRIVTLFPEMFEGPFRASIVGRAAQRGTVDITLHDLREYTHDRHRTVDDTPYGGGPGMVMMAPPLFEAVEDLAAQEQIAGRTRPTVVLTSPQGRPLTQTLVRELGAHPALTIVCGHYEGVDERFIEACVDHEVSIGDYVLTGGELPAMVLVDALVRLQPGALGDPDSATRESFGPGLDGLLQGPVYTRPSEFRGRKVPEVLFSGDHARVTEWRRKTALARTRQRRPDLLRDWPSA